MHRTCLCQCMSNSQTLLAPFPPHPSLNPWSRNFHLDLWSARLLQSLCQKVTTPDSIHLIHFCPILLPSGTYSPTPYLIGVNHQFIHLHNNQLVLCITLSASPLQFSTSPQIIWAYHQDYLYPNYICSWWDLPDRIPQELDQIIYKEGFHYKLDLLPFTFLIEHWLETKANAPVFQLPYTCPLHAPSLFTNPPERK